MSHPNKPDQVKLTAGATGGRQRSPSSTADQEISNVTPLELEQTEMFEVQQLSTGTFPISEASSSAVSLQVLVLSPAFQRTRIRFPLVRTATVELRRIASLADYQSAVIEGLSVASHSGSRLLLHVLLIDCDGWPVMGGRVRETDLYNCIPATNQSGLAGVRIFQLGRQLPSRASPATLLPVRRAEWSSVSALSGLEVHRFRIPWTVDWAHLNDHLLALASTISIMPTDPVDLDDFVLDQLSSFGLQYLLVTALPRGLPINSASTEDSRLATYPQILDAPARRDLLAVGVFVQTYNRTGRQLADRPGCKADLEHCKKISRLLGCSLKDTYMLFNQSTGSITINNYELFRESLIRTLRIPFKQVYLFISAHGEPGGFITSDGRTVPLSELVLSLKTIASHVTVFYQPCRGDNNHLDEICTELDGLSLTNQSGVGSSLPQTWPDCSCSAIFASCPGYASYSSAETGGWLLHALSIAVESFPFEFDLTNPENFRELAEKVQAVMRALTKDGRVTLQEKIVAILQIQFIVHLP